MITTDTTRWLELATSGTLPSWWKRNKAVASFIPRKVSVLDIGAGDKHIKKLISKDCHYTALDCVDDLSGETIVLDFNKTDARELIVGQFDYGVCSGVLEYISDPLNLLTFVLNNCQNVVLTYIASENRNHTKDEDNGWVNCLSLEQLTDLIESSGGRITHIDQWRRHTIICFNTLE